MKTSRTHRLLAPELLDRTVVLVAAPGEPQSEAVLAAALAAECTGLGARVASLDPYGSDGSPLAEEELDARLDEALPGAGGVDVLALDAAALFARGAAAGDAAAGLASCMQASWDLARAVANRGMLQSGGGLVVLIAPPPGAGELAEGARAGLENLARTLSIEWARFATRAVAIAPGDATEPHELAGLVAYLSSPAGAYFSGCQLDLRGPAAPRPA